MKYLCKTVAKSGNIFLSLPKIRNVKNFWHFILIGITLNVSAQKQWTLKDCLDYAAKNNIQIKQAELSAKIAKNNALQAKLNLLPTINGDVTNSYSFGNSVNPTTYAYENSNAVSLSMGLSTNLTLFAGLQQINNIAKTKQDFLAAQYNQQNTVNTTGLNLTNQFLQIVLNKELVKIAEEQLKISEKNLEVNKSKVKAGTLAEAALYELEAQLERDKSNLTQQKNNTEIALLVFKISLQLPENEAFDIVAPSTETYATPNISRYNIDQIYQQAIQTQPSIKASEAELSSAHYAEKIAKGALSPTLSFGFSLRDNYFSKAQTPTNVRPYLDSIGTPIYNSLTGTDPTQGIIGYDRLKVKYDYINTSFKDQFKQNFTKNLNLSLNIPIFNKWQRMTNISNAKIQTEIKSLQIDNAKNNLRRDVYQAYANLVSNNDNYKAAEKTVAASQKAYEVAEKRYNAGLANSFELQQSRNNLVAASSKLVQAKYNLLWSEKVVDFYAGNPIDIK